MRQKAVIFDMDGVLVDTEPLYIGLNQRFFRELGADVPLEEHYGYIGISATTMWTRIKEKNGLSQSVEELKLIEREMKFSHLETTVLEPVEGIPELLATLREHGFRLGIASSSLRKNIELIVDKLRLREFFEDIISGEEVQRGKPEPDIFLELAARCGLGPADCTVIEDSTNGVKAAKAAAMKCVGFLNPNSGRQDLSTADIIIQDFSPRTISSIVQLINS